jgi:uncharacterized protein YndB with AHSA1/START domain
VFTWGWEARDIGETLVTVELRAVGRNTELHLVHERLPSRDEVVHHAEGWGGCLDKLAAVSG